MNDSPNARFLTGQELSIPNSSGFQQWLGAAETTSNIPGTPARKKTTVPAAGPRYHPAAVFWYCPVVPPQIPLDKATNRTVRSFSDVKTSPLEAPSPASDCEWHIILCHLCVGLPRPSPSAAALRGLP